MDRVSRLNLGEHLQNIFREGNWEEDELDPGSSYPIMVASSSNFTKMSGASCLITSGVAEVSPATSARANLELIEGRSVL